MSKLMTRIKTLEKMVRTLTEKINSIQVNKTVNADRINKDDNSSTEYWKGACGEDGLNKLLGGPVYWNNVDASIPGLGVKPNVTPSKGYNKHFHNRYAGGALDVNSLELIEYDVDWANSSDYSEYHQRLWSKEPDIAKENKTESNGSITQVPKIGKLSVTFNANTGMWESTANEIDISKCYFVLRDQDGNIQTDDNGAEMKSYLYSTDNTKTSFVWDKYAKCWRLYACYAQE